MLVIKNLKASINNREILKGLNLKINPGEVHAIMGPNGSGKSTLTKVLMKIYSPKKGTCTLFEKNLKEYRNVNFLNSKRTSQVDIPQVMKGCMISRSLCESLRASYMVAKLVPPKPAVSSQATPADKRSFAVVGPMPTPTSFARIGTSRCLQHFSIAFKTPHQLRSPLG